MVSVIVFTCLCMFDVYVAVCVVFDCVVFECVVFLKSFAICFSVR